MPRYSITSGPSSSTSSAVSENSVVFYDAGGHSHDGRNSTLIDTTKYSLWDFAIDTIPTTSPRLSRQVINIDRFKNFIMNTVNDGLLSPAGITLGDGVVNTNNIVSGSITTVLIAANAVTADQILANTITTTELATDSIKSINYVGPQSATGFSTTGTFLRLDTGDIMTPGLYANGATGSLTINAAISGGTIDIGGNDSSSFHVNSNGDVWSGSGSYATAPFKISSTGVVNVNQTIGLTNYSISIGSNQVYFVGNTATVSSIVLDMSQYDNRIQPSTGIYFKDTNNPLLFSAIVAANNSGTHYLFMSSPNDNYFSIQQHSYAYLGANGLEIKAVDIGGHSSGVSADATDVTVSGWYTANVSAPVSVTIRSSGFTSGTGNIYLTSANSVLITSPTLTANGSVSFGNTLYVGANTTIAGTTRVANGTAGAPSVAFNADTNTGMYRYAENTIAFATAGVERLRIQSDGTLLMSTTNANLAGLPTSGSGTTAVWTLAFGVYALQRSSSLRDSKENIQEINNIITPDMVDQIEVLLWNRKTAPGIPEIGPIAEDIDLISPFLSSSGMDVDENGEIVKILQGINNEGWLSLLTLALQDARYRIFQLEQLLSNP